MVHLKVRKVARGYVQSNAMSNHAVSSESVQAKPAAELTTQPPCSTLLSRARFP